MGARECAVHDSFALSMGVEECVSSMKFRPIYEVAACSLGPHMRVSAYMVHPSVATSTLRIGIGLSSIDVQRSCEEEPRPLAKL